MEPKMTIAVHEPSNSLIVTAPEALFKEVEKLVKLIDTRSQQTVEVLKISRPLANDLQQILNGEMPVPNSRSSSSSRPSTTRPTNGSSSSSRTRSSRSR